MAQINFGGVNETVVTREEFPLEKARKVLENETIAVIGYGVQGPGQSLNLRDNGFNVIVGQREGTRSWERAVADGWVPGQTLFGIEEAAERGTLMGAIQGIFAAQYETLRTHGHTPSEAFNETVEELTQSLMPLVAENGMDWMYANCSTTAQRGALDWWKRFRDAANPVFEQLYEEVATGREAQRSIDLNSKPDYRQKLEEELRELRESEMWQAGAVVRKLRPENN